VKVLKVTRSRSQEQKLLKIRTLTLLDVKVHCLLDKTAIGYVLITSSGLLIRIMTDCAAYNRLIFLNFVFF